MKIQIVAREVIKPSSSTPKTYNLSLLDQVIPPDRIKSLFFYQNNSTGDLENAIAERTRCLKSSLSQALTLFYPFAGRLRDQVSISIAKDDGVEFLEARVSDSMSEYLAQLDIETLVAHLTVSDNSESCTPPLMIIQASFFTCGGSALGITYSHTVADASNLIYFVKEWAKIASGRFENVSIPEFNVPIIFPPIDRPFARRKNQMVVPVTRRFVFSAYNIANLQKKTSKEGTRKPTRVETVTTLIWCIGMRMFMLRAGDFLRPCTLFMPINVRRMLPSPVGDRSFGNLIQLMEVPNNKGDTTMPHLISLLRERIVAFQEIYNNKLLRGEELSSLFIECFRNHLELNLSDSLTISSACGLHIYEVDFGWGKPAWACLYTDVCYSTLLMDTRDDASIQAFVTLPKEDMDLFANDEELLTYANPDRSVLD